MLSRVRAAITLALIAGTSGSCATRPPRESGLAMNTYATGGGQAYVYRAAYFNPAEERDPRWEERRLVAVRQMQLCPAGAGHRILRRDVRWYPPTRHSGRRCAAIVYTAQCDTAEPRMAELVEQRRLFILRMDADSPPGRNCGDKTRFVQRRVPTEEELFARLLTTSARCDAPDRAPEQPIRVYDETRINAAVRVHPSLAGAPGYVFSRRYTPLAVQGISYRFSQAGLIPPRLRAPSWPGPIIRPPRIVDNGTNILVSLDYGLGEGGRPYCVQLTARQGDRIWRRTIRRPGFVEHLREQVGLDQSGMSNDPSRYWDPLIDARRLVWTLGDELAANADPVYAQGRPASAPAR